MRVARSSPGNSAGHSFRPSRPAAGEESIAAQLGIAVLVTAFIPLWQFPTWQKSEQEKADLLAAIAPMPEGSRLFWAHAGLRSPEVVKTEIGAYHIGAYAVIAKRALVQSMFVYPGQQPIRFRGPAYQNAPRTRRRFWSS